MASMITRNIATITAHAYKVDKINPDTMTADLVEIGSCTYYGTTENDKTAREMMGLKGASNVYLSHEMGDTVRYAMTPACFAAHSTTDKILGGISRTTNKYHVQAVIPGEFDPQTMTCKMFLAGEGDYFSSSENDKLAREVTQTKNKGGVKFITKLVDSSTRYMTLDDFVRLAIVVDDSVDSDDSTEDTDN